MHLETNDYGMKRILLLLFILHSSLFALHLHSQRPNQAYWEYIEKYRSMAQDQMMRHRIPASITLAQGLLESAAGRSELALKANNHFGIKVGTGWTGPYVIKSDDRPDDRFRKYNNVAESYEDHSQFLLKPRYASLFKLNITDYKGWANGLKQCGYATSPTYAQQLITIIENYGLHQYCTTYNPRTGRTGFLCHASRLCLQQELLHCGSARRQFPYHFYDDGHLEAQTPQV